MIKIVTRDFGEIEVSEEQIISFPNGVYAFDDAKHFALISPLGENVYPMWLQCTDDISPCFIVFDPRMIYENYKIELTESEKALLKLTDGSEIRALCTAKVPENYKETTVNMKSPIIVNSRERIATQVILPEDYPFRLPIYKSEKGAE